MPRTKPDKYTIIYTLSETCISYLVPVLPNGRFRIDESGCRVQTATVYVTQRRHVSKIVANLAINHPGYKGNAFPRAKCRSCFHPSRPRDKKLGPDGPTDE